MMVMAPETEDFAVTLEQFRAAITHWQPYAEASGPILQDRPVDALIKVARPDEPFFQIFHYRDGDMLSTAAHRNKLLPKSLSGPPTRFPRPVTVNFGSWTRNTPATPYCPSEQGRWDLSKVPVVTQEGHPLDATLSCSFPRFCGVR
jgi:hypothetical protein